METEITPELKEQLLFIEKKSKLLSLTPPNVQLFTIFLWCLFVVVLIAEVLAMKNGSYFFALFFPVLAVFLMVTHFHQKKLFNMYSNANEIISYYKQKTALKGDPMLDSNPSPGKLIP